jgi:DNA gyrase/topoisomerase IV subunit B
MAKKVYNEDSISVYEGMAGVRKRPTMYLGDRPVFQCFKEAVDNCLDELSNAGGSFKSKTYDVFLRIAENKKGEMTYTVVDKGRGIPVGIHKKTKESTLTTIMTKIHAGGKFDSDSYAGGSRGTHGVGVSAVNAVSSSFEVWTYREKAWHYQAFKNGEPVAKIKKANPAAEFAANKCGTVIIYTLDKTIAQIAKDKIDIATVREWLEVSAILESPAKIVLEYKGKEKMYHTPDGPAHMVKRKLASIEVEGIGKPCIIEDAMVTVACQWGNTDSEEFNGYVNGLSTPSGGTHVQAFYDALTKAFNANSSKKLKTPDIRVGMVGFINLKLSNAEYSSQTKEKLMSPITKELSEKLLPHFDKWLKSNKSMVKQIVVRAMKIRDAKAEVSKIMKAASSIKESRKGALLPGILTTADPKCPPGQRELFLVEGESAGGTGRKARYREYQELLCLSGKPINVARTPISKALGSKPVQNILAAVGIDANHFKKEQKAHTFRVGRIIILTDPDSDGFHIANLILTVFHKLIPEVFELGMVYIVDAPLYFGTLKDKKFFGYTLNEVKSKTPKGGMITRMKGWGESPIDILREIAFDKKTRRLFKVMPVKTKDGVKFDKIVGDDASIRKEILGIT